MKPTVSASFIDVQINSKQEHWFLARVFYISPSHRLNKSLSIIIIQLLSASCKFDVARFLLTSLEATATETQAS